MQHSKNTTDFLDEPVHMKPSFPENAFSNVAHHHSTVASKHAARGASYSIGCTGPELVRQNASPKSDCLSQHTHLQHNGHQLAASWGKQKTSGEREGRLQPSRESDSAETKLQPATWIITGQHWASMVRSKPQVHSHTQTRA